MIAAGATPPRHYGVTPNHIERTAKMLTRFEVFIREDLVDAAGEGLIKDIEDLNISGAKDARFIRVTEVEGRISPKAAKRIASELLSDPVSQRYVIGRVHGDMSKGAWVLEVRFNHGVTDPVAESTLKGIADMKIAGVTAAKTSTKVILRGRLTEEQADTICRKLLANSVIQSYSIEKK
jgi:phosphoribosylformylglycinamidine (FGAM) synthase PurS component